MLLPKRVKYRKSQRGKMKGLAVSGSTVSFGEYGLKALECGWLRNTQIESARVILSRRLRKGGKLWIRVFPDKPITKMPAESRMGKGKGEVDGWVAVIRRGRIIFELGGVSEDFAKESFRLVSYKFPFRTRFVTRRR
ncbi:MAG: 50S ribosomal protein L16 [Candidatus Omnitrophica bacterium]|nr:50S ribosomal protein L16 [Candidatus Omnitrophota bacterium]MCM8827217.1 50S ribosomal protein L16 [Candidatus Omnitrophota bacterium]